MNDNKVGKLRAYYHSLMGFHNVVEGTLLRNSGFVRKDVVDLIEEELLRVRVDFPDVSTPNNLRRHRFSNGEDIYYSNGILAVLAPVLGRLKVQMESVDVATVTDIKDFTFIKDKAVQTILERDYAELQKCLITDCHKSAIILAGSSIEAILLDLLLTNSTTALSSAKAPKGSDITRWDLEDLINVAVETNLVEPGVERLSHSVRHYWNLIHPGNEVRNKLTIAKEEAEIAFNVLNIVHRCLSS
jgi:hypothetical protein